MNVYSADFSGARNPSRGIYYAEGLLEGGSLIINQVVHCDDRLDLLTAIHFSKAPWGLDFPFSISVEAFKLLKINAWNELLVKAEKSSRIDFDLWIAGSGILSCESKCRKHSSCCRAVDASINSFSPLKRTNPNMRMMTYAGLKLLSYLRRLGNAVYPFDYYNGEVARLYEVYPSNAWKQLGFKRNTDLSLFAERFTNKYDFKVELKSSLRNVENLDAADAVAACVTMAYALTQYRLENDWDVGHDWISDVEWKHRLKEGLIVKVV